MLKKLFLPTILFIGLLAASSVKAVCPLCTVAIGAGVGLSRWLGVDDLISGVWIGGLMVSIIFWTLDWLNKKKITFKLRWLAVSSIFYLFLIIPFYFTGIMGHPANKFFGMDRLLFGTIVGSLVFWFAVYLHERLKKRNNGKSFFPYQKIVIPVASLIISSLILYLITLI